MLNSIETTELSVTIKSLKVNNKKMSLAVFRQLPRCHGLVGRESGILDDQLNIWGHVRYEIKSEGCLWVVCEKQGQLVRCKWPNRPGSLIAAEKRILVCEAYLQEKESNANVETPKELEWYLKGSGGWESTNLLPYLIGELACEKNLTAAWEKLDSYPQLFIGA